MKRILSLIIILGIAIHLVGCTKSENKVKDDLSNKTSSSEPSSSTSDSSSLEEEDASSGEEGLLDEEDSSDSDEDSDSIRENVMRIVSEDMEQSDENGVEAMTGLKEKYPKLKKITSDTYYDNDDFYYFALYCAYFLTYYDSDTKGYYVGDCGMDYVDSIENGDLDYKEKLQDFKEAYLDNISTIYDKEYAEGQYKVGKDIHAGEYVLFTSGGGYFCVSTDENGDNIVFNENFNYNSIITIKSGEYLELSDCTAVPIKYVKKISKKEGEMFKIGKYLKAGSYKIKADSGDSGYYCIYSSSRQQNIVSNDNFKGTRYIKVRNGQYLLLSDCKIVSK